MDGAGAVARSVEAVNAILEGAVKASTTQAEKLIKMNVEAACASQPGVGEQIDLTA